MAFQSSSRDTVVQLLSGILEIVLLVYVTL